MPITDPTQIPESRDQVDEYAAELARASDADDVTLAEQLAHAIAESTAASEHQRADSYFRFAQMLEREGRTDDAIDNYRRAGNHGHQRGEAEATRLRGTEQVGQVEAARPPANEAEARRYFDVGRAAAQSQDWERVVEVFEALYGSSVVDAEQQAAVAYFLGEAYRNQGSHDAAYRMYQEAHETGHAHYVGLAQQRLTEYHQQDHNEAAGTEVASTASLADTDAVVRMLQAGVDRYDNNDSAGAEARFTAAHGAAAATAEQRGYAAYFLGVIAWYANNFDVARAHFTEARDAGGDTAENARQMLAQHWGN